MNRINNKRAFTLIELIVVIAVLGVLVLLAAPRLLGYTEEAQLVRIQNDVKVMENKMAETLAQDGSVYKSWDDNFKDLGTLILKNQLFDKEGLARSVDVEHLINKGSNLASLDNEVVLASNLGRGGELYSISTNSTDEENGANLSLDPSAGYKIVPESFKKEVNTKLDGTFYVNKFGKVYYEHGKPIASAKTEQVLACVAAETLDYEFDGSTGKIVKYNGSLQHIIIPGAFEVDGECVPVRSIGPGAFMNGGYKTITIPQSVKEIEEDAFKGNELKEVEIPHSVEYIGPGAFSDNRLESVVINRGADTISIGTGAFNNNGSTGTSTVSPTFRLPTPSDLKVVFNKSTGTIVSGYGGHSGGSSGSGGSSSSGSGGSSSNSSKQYNNSSKVVSIPEEVVVDGEVHEIKEIAKGAFQGQGIISVEFPDSLERIDDYAFAGNQLVGVKIPQQIGHIGNYAFAFNEINEERTIKYVNILDERNYEPQIDKLGNIAESGNKINVLSGKVSLLDHIFVISKANFEIPDSYNPIDGDNLGEIGDDEDTGEFEFTDESKFSWVRVTSANSATDKNNSQQGFGGEGYFKYTGKDEEVVVIPHEIKGVNVTTYYNMFKESGTEIKKVVSTNKSVTNMAYMFRMSKAKELDLSELNTSNVIYMTHMLSGSQATVVDLSGLDTTNVTHMTGMFYASRAKLLDLSSFNTSNVQMMNQMFMSSYATSIDLSSFDTSNVIHMGQLFANSKVKSLDLTNFNTSNVTGLGMLEMFSNSVATEIDLSSFDTSKITNMQYMFSKSKVTFLDLSSFDTSNVTGFLGVFRNSEIKTAYAKTQADADRLNNSSYKPNGLNFVVKPKESTSFTGYGIYNHEISKDGKYLLEVSGGSGGDGKNGYNSWSPKVPGFDGLSVSGEIFLNKGDILEIKLGASAPKLSPNQGGKGYDNGRQGRTSSAAIWGGGGGGSSEVWLNDFKVISAQGGRGGNAPNANGGTGGGVNYTEGLNNVVTGTFSGDGSAEITYIGK